MADAYDPLAPSEPNATLAPTDGKQARDMSQRLQFSLAGLMMLTAVLAAGMVLLKSFGHWGLVIITFASFAFTLLRARWVAYATTGLMVSLLWGVALPLLCFAYDPGVFVSSDASFSAPGTSVVAMALWQMCLLLTWLFVGARGPAWNGFMAGGMVVGALLAGMIAIPMLFLAMAGLFVPRPFYGLPGFIPLMTAWIYARSWSKASFLIPPTGGASWRFQVAFGISLLVALCWPPLVIWLANSLVGPFHFPTAPHTNSQFLLYWD